MNRSINTHVSPSLQSTTHDVILMLEPMLDHIAELRRSRASTTESSVDKKEKEGDAPASMIEHELRKLPVTWDTRIGSGTLGTGILTKRLFFPFAIIDSYYSA